VLPTTARKNPLSPWLWLILAPLLAACLVFAPDLAGKVDDDNGAVLGVGAAATAVSPVRAALALAGILTLAVAGLLVWRRARGPGAGKPATDRTLRCLESVRLSPKNRVHLLACGEDLFVVGEGDTGVVILHKPDATTEEAVAAGHVVRRQAAGDLDDRLDFIIDDDARDEELGAVPTDLVLEPMPRRTRPAGKSAANAATDPERFRKLLDQVRAEVGA
jgi:flagellar biogenesis protein FliO